jgi:imidazoleglycerol phosphate dehydratase HisB
MADIAFVSSEFDIFALKPVQNSICATYEVVYLPLAPIDQSDLEFLIPADLSTYVNPDIKLYIRGKFTKPDGGDLDTSDHTAGVNNFVHSLFSQCTITLNGVNITGSGDHYNYRAYLKTLLT